MDFKEPTVVYIPSNNMEAHLVVDLLMSQGIPAMAVEDQSGASLWAFGTISQFHKPKVWVDASTAEAARALIVGYEQELQQRRLPASGPALIYVVCEECGKTTLFPESQNGTLQECPECYAYVDVGSLDWEEDFGQPEEDAEPAEDADELAEHEDGKDASDESD